MSDGPERHDGGPGTKQVVRQEVHLVDIAEVFDHSETGAALKGPFAAGLIGGRDAMTGVDVNNLPAEPTGWLGTDLHEPGGRFRCLRARRFDRKKERHSQHKRTVGTPTPTHSRTFRPA